MYLESIINKCSIKERVDTDADIILLDDSVCQWCEIPIVIERTSLDEIYATHRDKEPDIEIVLASITITPREFMRAFAEIAEVKEKYKELCEDRERGRSDGEDFVNMSDNAYNTSTGFPPLEVSQSPSGDTSVLGGLVSTLLTDPTENQEGVHAPSNFLMPEPENEDFPDSMAVEEIAVEEPAVAVIPNSVITAEIKEFVPPAPKVAHFEDKLMYARLNSEIPPFFEDDSCTEYFLKMYGDYVVILNRVSVIRLLNGNNLDVSTFIREMETEFSIKYVNPGKLTNKDYFLHLFTYSYTFALSALNMGDDMSCRKMIHFYSRLIYS